MTILEFKDRFDIKNEKLIYSWIEKGFIPGIERIDGDVVIPDRAWPPYTKARARTAQAVYSSITVAISKRKYVSAELYKMSKQEYAGYIGQLRNAGLILVQEENGVDYYQLTFEGQRIAGDSKAIKKLIDSLVIPVVGAVAEGVAKAVIEKSIG